MPTQLTRAELRRVAAQRPTTVTIGVFDGVHRGHVALLRRVIERAAANGSAAGVVTFHPHPQHVLRPDMPLSYLTSLEDRLSLLTEAGLDIVMGVGEAFAALMVVTGAISPPIFLASFCLELAMAWSVSGMGDIAEPPNLVVAVAWMALAVIFLLLAYWVLLVLFRAIRCALDVDQARAALYLILYLVACMLPVYFLAAT